MRVSTGVCAYNIVATTCSSGRFNLNQVIASTPNFTGEFFNMSKVTKGNVISTLTDAQKAQFRNPGPGEIGDLPRVSMRGPGYAHLDLSIFKKFGMTFLGEAGEAQLRIQLYNALNQVNWSDPNTNINSGSFGVITGTRAARIGELALKIVF
ncbi:MAG: hypothetical protein HY646_22355 [Acidobacteria bacterium]|nr:hypothetical protein [Acidobacteriota bacterium]